MENAGLWVFGCDKDERRLFEQEARRRRLMVALTAQPLTARSAARVEMGAAVSVSHKTPVEAAALYALAERGVGYLCSRSVGLNHIDLKTASRLGIRVTGVPYSPQSVAEHTLMLMLMALRRVPALLRCMDTGDFRLTPTRPRCLQGMTVGVVGNGRIGGAVARLLRGMGCKVLICDPGTRDALTLEQLLPRCDIITLHLPLTPQTRHLMDRAHFQRMRRGAILVNAARGALVEPRALEEALTSGWLGAAALDVIEGEEGWFYRDCRGQAPPFQALMALDNVVLTPHMAFYTQEALADVVRGTLENCFYEGGLAKWIV